MKTFFYILALMTIISCKPKIKQANDSVESPSSQILKDSIETKSDNFIITAGKIAKNESIYCIVEKMPSFVGGDTARIRYFDENIYYPKSAIDDSITGIVYVTFVINEDGSVSRVKIIRGLQHDIDNMCIKVVQNMPDWIPGEQMGKPVKVSFNMPIKFSFANRSKYQSNIIGSNAKDPKNEEANDIEIKIYPNPAKDYITLGTTKITNDMQFQIINTKGQVLKNGQILSEKETIDISRLENGMYMIRIISKELKFSKTEKLIKKD